MKIAVVATVWFPFSHADVVVSRWLEPYPGDARLGWEPRTQIASVYLAQVPENDVGREVCAKFGVPFFGSIREALTLGGDRLAVDAVLLIGEHGDYPENHLHQKLYPRKGFFDEIVQVFRESGRGVPVFNDKHLSWSFAEAGAMLAAARELSFPVYAGSSIPHCPMEPEAEIGPNDRLSEALALFYGHEEHYGYHGIEFLQSVLEKRGGGETGIARVRTLEGPSLNAAWDKGEIPADLVQAALTGLGYPDEKRILPFVLARGEGLLAFQFEHEDGLRVTHLRIPKWVNNWSVALRVEGREILIGKPVQTDPMGFYNNFAFLNRRVEQFFLTGQAPNSVLRTHLAGGVLEAALQARETPSVWQETPHLRLAY
jgi:hypothetical protein